MKDADLDCFRRQLIRLASELRALEETSRASVQPVTLDQASVGRLSRMDAMQAQQMAVETSRRRRYRRDPRTLMIMGCSCDGEPISRLKKYRELQTRAALDLFRLVKFVFCVKRSSEFTYLGVIRTDGAGLAGSKVL